MRHGTALGSGWITGASGAPHDVRDVPGRAGWHPGAARPSSCAVVVAARFRVAVRDGHVVVIKEGSVRWRSRRVYTLGSSEFDSVAYAPNKVAFGFVHGRLWVSRFDGHEHAVGWNEGALVWTKRGEVELSSGSGTGGEDILVVREGQQTGRLLAREQSQWAGCGWIVTLVWHGDWLLYPDSEVDVLALDTAGDGRIDLSKTAQQLPGVSKDEASGQPAGLDFAVWG